MPILSLAREAAQRELPAAQLSLEISTDPESGEESLVLIARLPRYDASVVDAIERAEASYLDHLSGTQGSLVLTTDFASPETPSSR